MPRAQDEQQLVPAKPNTHGLKKGNVQLSRGPSETSPPGPGAVRPHTTGSPRSRWIVWGLLVLVTLLVYSPLRHHPFLVYDDPGYVTENPMVRAGLTWAGVKRALQIQPDYAEAHNDLATALIDAGQLNASPAQNRPAAAGAH